jgi:hypothetical protein
MTTPSAGDVGNELTAPGPSQLVTSLVLIGGKQYQAVTIRTPSATLTVFLDKAEAQGWAAMIEGTAGRMTAAGLYVSNGQMPAPPMRGGQDGQVH